MPVATGTQLASVKAAAAGRWKDVLIHFGFPAEVLDGRHHLCPKCGGKDRFRYIDDDAGAVFCNQCFSLNNGDGIAAVRWMTGDDFPAALRRIGEFLGLNGSERNSNP